MAKPDPRRRGPWRLWSSLADDGTGLLHDTEHGPDVKLPPKAELSGDGKWATVYGENGQPVAVYVRAKP